MKKHFRYNSEEGTVLVSVVQVTTAINPLVLRKAKIVYNFDPCECTILVSLSAIGLKYLTLLLTGLSPRSSLFASAISSVSAITNINIYNF